MLVAEATRDWEQGGGVKAAAAETLALFLLPGRSHLTLTDIYQEILLHVLDLGGGVIRTGDSPKSDGRGEYGIC